MKLAVVGKIIEVHDIKDADRIKRAVVVCGDAGKWSGVVGLDIAVGDHVTVFLQDAVLPPNEAWSFMEKHKWRVRMARFKGVPSECLIIRDAPKLPIGADLTEAMGVTKHHKPIPESMSGVARGDFPSFIPKTDEPNFQTVPEMVALMEHTAWVGTLKYDGTSCTAWNDPDTGELRVASRNLELMEFSKTGASNAYWRAARMYDMTKLPWGCALQFEVVGPGIQGNPMGIDSLIGVAFRVYDFATHRRRSHHDLLDITKAIGMPHAEILYRSPPGAWFDEDEMRGLAAIKVEGKQIEGIVIQPVDGDWSFKVLSLDYKD